MAYDTIITITLYLQIKTKTTLKYSESSFVLGSSDKYFQYIQDSSCLPFRRTGILSPPVFIEVFSDVCIARSLVFSVKCVS